MTDDNDNGNTFSRRKILGGIATVGAAGAVAGSGTMAIFNDTEEASAQVTAGTLDLKINGKDSSSGEPVKLIDVGGEDDEDTVVRPGSESAAPTTVTMTNAGDVAGLLSVSFTETNTENGQNDPESEADSEEGGELGDVLELSPGGDVWWTVDEFKQNVGGTYELAGGANHRLSVKWRVPVTAGNEIQSDGFTLKANLRLYQAKNTVAATTGQGWPSFTSGAHWTAQATTGQRGNSDNYDLDGQVSRDVTWTEGEDYPFTLSYDGQTATFDIANVSETVDPDGTASTIAVMAKGYIDTHDVVVDDVTLDGDYVVPSPLVGTNGNKEYLLLEGQDLSSFTLNGVLRFEETTSTGSSTLPEGDGAGLQILVDE